MYRKWKGVAAIGMAVLIGCLMPMGTMMAAAEDSEAVQEAEAGSETDAADNDEGILGDIENAGEEEDADEDEKAGEEVNADEDAKTGEEENAVVDENIDDEDGADDEVNADDVIADDEIESDDNGNDGIALMSEEEGPEAGDEEVQASTDAPVIDIKVNGESCKVDGLGGNIDYKYVVNKLEFELSASQGSTFCYFINDKESVPEENSIKWTEENISGVKTIEISDLESKNNYAYVVYVKAETDGQTVYARSCGIVVDVVPPDIKGVEDRGTCQEGTTFTVTDGNLESVTVNGNLVTHVANNEYQVTEAGTTCKIIAKDKAGNETECSIEVTARNLAADGTISVNGTYYLKPGTSFKLGEGQWQVDGDKSVYSGGNTFYVKADGDYKFTKR